MPPVHPEVDTPNQWLKEILVILGLLAVTLLYFNDVLTGRLLLMERDLSTFFYPFRFTWVETVQQGNFPFWNPYLKCGVPLFATIQPGVLYPLSIFYLFMPVDLAFNWTIVFHFFLAAAFTFLLMRELGASVQGGLAAGLAFLFSGYLISVHNVLNTLLAVSWYPLVIFCGCRLVRKGKARWAVAGGTSLCCMFFAGGIEIVLFALASVFLLCLYPKVLLHQSKEEMVSPQRRMVLLGLAVTVFLGLSMVQMLPFLELYPHSHRRGGVPLYEATTWSMAPRDLFYFVLPDIYGPRKSPDKYWQFQNYLKSVYMGPLVFVLAGIHFGRRRRGGLALLAGMAVALGLALGRHTVIYAFLYEHVPLFATMRFPVKFLFLFVFYLCVAAGLGLDVLKLRFAENRYPALWFQLLLVGTVLPLTAILILTRFYPEWSMDLAQQWWGSYLDETFLPKALHNLNRLLFVSTLAVIVIFFGLCGKLARKGTVLIVTLLALDLFLGNRGYTDKLDAVKFHKGNEIISRLKQDPDLFRFYVVEDVKNYKASVSLDPDGRYWARKQILNHDLMIEHHLFDIDGYNVPIQPRYERFMGIIRNEPLATAQPLLNMLNVKYLLASGNVDLPGFVFVRNGILTSRLYENLNYLPRAFLVKDFQVVNSDQEFARIFYAANFDSQQMVLLESVPERLLALKTESSVPSLKEEVRVLEYTSNRVVLAVRAPEATLLFMSEAYFPGWKAYVDGREEKILRANYVFRAIPLGPGAHLVEVVYKPQSFKTGMGITLMTSLLLLVGWALAVIREKARQRAQLGGEDDVQRTSNVKLHL
jgi:hypothetical protein